ncbi:MAG: hypothetical protein B7Z72_08625 [Gemmatimonadetes bacterium 21-71-4]|nr:MAG: hypothetical protein B7Z72_08625 [Gemmatimonadetes bacterium 21-71-4]
MARAPVEQAAGAPMDVAVHAGYNDASRSWDGELTLARALGPIRLFGIGRTFSAFRAGTGRSAAGGGFTLRLNQYVALAGDAVTLVDRRANEDVAWSAGVQLGIPYTPHTLAVTVSNANTTTLEGASLGVPQGRRWGFEYTIPISLGGHFGGRRPENGSAPAMGLALQAGGSIGAEVHLTNQLRFVPDTVRIKVGQSVLWINGSAFIHTVTADARLAQRVGDGRVPAGATPFSSGDLSPGMVFEHVFHVPGEYRYFCIPHEASGMRGTIIVE